VQRNREWSEAYRLNRERFGETLPDMPFESSAEVNEKGNRSWQRFVQRPSLLKDIARLQVPALFLCASEDVRPNWPAMQIGELMPNAVLKVIDGAAHYLWLTHGDAVRAELRAFPGLSV